MKTKELIEKLKHYNERAKLMGRDTKIYVSDDKNEILYEIEELNCFRSKDKDVIYFCCEVVK